MRQSATVVLLAAALVALPGCSLFRGAANAYQLPADQRPLEIPPELVVADGAAVPDGTQSALRSQTGAQRPAAPAMADNGFSVSAPRDEVYTRIGEVLEGVEGLEIASRAQLLGAYDVTYRGANFLVRVTPTTGATFVSAVDPRGLPTAGEGAAALMAALKTELGGE